MTDPIEAPTTETAPPDGAADLTGPPPTKETASPEIAQGEGLTEAPAPGSDVVTERAPEEELLAPNIPRLERPMGTSRT